MKYEIAIKMRYTKQYDYEVSRLDTNVSPLILTYEIAIKMLCTKQHDYEVSRLNTNVSLLILTHETIPLWRI